MTRSIRFREPYASNFEEVARAIAEKHDGDVPYPRTFAIRTFVDIYVEDHPDEFTTKDRQIAYLGGESVKGVPEEDPEPATPQDREIIENDGDESDGDDGDDKITFSYQEGYDG